MMQGKDGDGDKPYSCPVPGCKKRYKNVNGMKYHAKHGHKKDTKYVNMGCRGIVYTVCVSGNGKSLARGL